MDNRPTYGHSLDFRGLRYESSAALRRFSSAAAISSVVAEKGLLKGSHRVRAGHPPMRDDTITCTMCYWKRESAFVPAKNSGSAAPVERLMFTGNVAAPGFGHFRRYRPKFYRAVLDLSGLALYEGTINIRIDGEMPEFPLPNTQRIPGQDQIDLDHHQDILITPCVMEGRAGFWILPVFQGTWDPNPAGHFPNHIIEISLVEKLHNIAPGSPVSLEIPGATPH